MRTQVNLNRASILTAARHYRTADAPEETFRDSDLLARLGGDELAVLAWEASVHDIRTILNRLINNLEKANADESRYKLSLSVVARYDPHTPLSLADLMAKADQDMYQQRYLVRRTGFLALHLHFVHNLFHVRHARG